MSNNSSQPSPSLLNNLRQYRFQKRPVASSSENGFRGQNGASAFNHFASGSSAAAPAIAAAPLYKRIRLMDSESDSESHPSPGKAPPAPAPPQPLDQPTKERRLANMTNMFPDISTIIIKSILLKHNWNEERTRDILLDFDPEQEEINKSVAQKKTMSSAFTQFLENYPSQYKSQPSGHLQGNYRQPSKKVAVKRRKDCSSDDSDFDDKQNKQDRVFDSDEDSDTEITNELTGDKRGVFDFLSTALEIELQMLSGCSLKKAQAIISCRPFKSWMEMVEKFKENKYLNTDILNAAQELLRTRNNIQKLMKKCTSLATQMETAVAAGAGVKHQPTILAPGMKLASYQLVGLNWLAVMHAQKVSGILADEMGLGKTVQVIAFLAHLKETNQIIGTQLIVVPASTLDNWKQEFERWCPSFRVVVYYGNQEERRSLRVDWARGGLKEVDIVLTTYHLVRSCPEERKMFRVMPMQYVVFDEAHMLKNMSTQRYEQLIRIKASHRLLLTGTPLQNNLLELMSLLCFVMPHLFANNTDDLKSLFQKSSKTSAKDKNPDEEVVPLFEQTQITQAKRIMKPFVLRRLKQDVLKELPPKEDHTLTCPMLPQQHQQYTDLITSFSCSTDGVIKSSSEYNSMAMMMDMRKLANHPLLLRYYYDEERLRGLAVRLAADMRYKQTNKQHIHEDLRFMSDFQIHQLTKEYKSISSMKVPDEYIVSSGKFAKLDEMLPKLRQQGHRVLIFSQFTMMLDIIEPFLTIRKYPYLRLDGSTAVTLRQDLIDQYNQEDIFIFLLSTKAGGLGINLTAADTVIIHDIDFNPYNDKQAEDRCHRMGQKRPVTIYRLLSGGTIEEGIYQVAQEKLSLERDITNTDENEPQEVKNVLRLLNSALGITK